MNLGLTIGNLTIATENNKTSFHKYVSKKGEPRRTPSLVGSWGNSYKALGPGLFNIFIKIWAKDISMGFEMEHWIPAIQSQQLHTMLWAWGRVTGNLPRKSVDSSTRAFIAPYTWHNEVASQIWCSVLDQSLQERY